MVQPEPKAFNNKKNQIIASLLQVDILHIVVLKKTRQHFLAIGSYILKGSLRKWSCMAYPILIIITKFFYLRMMITRLFQLYCLCKLNLISTKRLHFCHVVMTWNQTIHLQFSSDSPISSTSCIE